MTTQELTREIGDIKPRVAAIEEKVEGNAADIREIKDEQKEQRRLLVVIERIASGLKNVEDKVDDISRRVCHIEEKPGKKWESFVWLVITLVAGVVVGILSTKLGL